MRDCKSGHGPGKGSVSFLTWCCGAGVQGTWVPVPVISNSRWMVGSHVSSWNHFICFHIICSNVTTCLVQPLQVDSELFRLQAHLQGTWRGATVLSKPLLIKTLDVAKALRLWLLFRVPTVISMSLLFQGQSCDWHRCTIGTRRIPPSFCVTPAEHCGLPGLTSFQLRLSF